MVVADPTVAGNLASVSAAGALNVAGTVVLSDGTTTPNAIAGDSGQNALIMTRGRKSVTFSTTTAQAVASADVSNYSWVSLQINTQGTGSLITFQGSNDNVNWVMVSLNPVGNFGSTFLSQNAGGSGNIYSGPLNTRYFQLNVTGITAGTTSGVLEFFSVGPGQFGIATLATLGPVATGGLTLARIISAATTNATSVKTAAGQIYNIQAFNVNASARYLKLYNKASAPTVGTDTPVATYFLAPTTGALVIEAANGIAFSAGIAFAITANMADSDTTAIGASDVVVNIQYK
jgi:hypothetical protein